MSKSLEHIFIGRSVYCPWRHEAGRMPIGHIFGFVWDTERNGVIIQFKDDAFLTRYFCSWEQMEQFWKGDTFLLDETIEFVELLDEQEFVQCDHVRLLAKFPRNRKLIPIWSQYMTKGA